MSKFRVLKLVIIGLFVGAGLMLLWHGIWVVTGLTKVMMSPNFFLMSEIGGAGIGGVLIPVLWLSLHNNRCGENFPKGG